MRGMGEEEGSQAIEREVVGNKRAKRKGFNFNKLTKHASINVFACDRLESWGETRTGSSSCRAQDDYHQRLHLHFIL